MLLSVNNLTKSYGERTLFCDLSFLLDKKERLCVTGKNGCGKTTLLKIIAGEITADNGSVSKDNVRISYLEQIDNEIDNLSGGEKTKKRLEEIFDDNPSLLILDEPTNHLDMISIEWLERKIMSYKGALILVSHDRFLLDKVATKVLDLNTKPHKLYKGNYSSYLKQKEVIIKTIENSQKKYDDKIKHEEAVIKKLREFNRQKSIKRAESRVKQISKIKGPDEFIDKKTSINISLTPKVESGNDVLRIVGLKKYVDERLLFSDVNFTVKKGEHIGLVGNNGTGKTTIFNIILKKIKSNEGECSLGTNVNIAYYDQKLNNLNEKNLIFDEIREAYSDMTDTQIRNALAAFYFFNDDAFKKIESLSGGERGRLSLCKLMLSDANFLLLDEPTNHLDYESSEALENAINLYKGTILFISHDRYFLNKCAKRILDLSNHTVYDYLGNYSEHIEKKNELINRNIIKPQYSSNKVEISDKSQSEGRLNWEEEKQKKAKREKALRDEKRISSIIEEIEKRISDIEQEEQKPQNASDFVKLRELMDEKNKLLEELDNAYNQYINITSGDS